MLTLVLESNDPVFNLAAEDLLLHGHTEDFLVLSVNNPSVIIGKHQVTHREVNARLTGEDGIPVLRRISGGGAVYHDRGNLNFAFIRQSEEGKQVDFRYYTAPVIDFLASLGIKAVFEGKNDLTVDGLKISGNAEHVFRERVLHHGTLLFDASLPHMKKYLKPDSENYSTRGVASNRTSVTNLRSRLKGIETMDKFMKTMETYFFNSFPGMKRYVLTEDELKKTRDLIDSKYGRWDWNWGYGPPYTFTAAFDISGKRHTCRLLVKDGIIWESDIAGSKELAQAGKSLIGCRHMYMDILKVFHERDIPVSDEEVYGFF